MLLRTLPKFQLDAAVACAWRGQQVAVATCSIAQRWLAAIAGVSQQTGQRERCFAWRFASRFTIACRRQRAMTTRTTMTMTRMQRKPPLLRQTQRCLKNVFRVCSLSADQCLHIAGACISRCMHRHLSACNRGLLRYSEVPSIQAPCRRWTRSGCGALPPPRACSCSASSASLRPPAAAATATRTAGRRKRRRRQNPCGGGAAAAAAGRSGRWGCRCSPLTALLVPCQLSAMDPMPRRGQPNVVWFGRA